MADTAVTVTDEKSVEVAITPSDQRSWEGVAKLNVGVTWNKKNFVAKQEIGALLSVKMVGRLMLVNGLETLESAEKAIDVATEIAEDADLDPDERIKAVAAVAFVTNAHSAHMERLMKVAADIDEVKKSPAQEKPPVPSFYAQINVNAGTPEAKTGATVEVKSVPVK